MAANWWDDSPVVSAGKPSFDLAAALSETDKALNLPAGFSAAQIQVESGGKPKARSPAGAMGLAQVMPATLATLSKRLGRDLNPDDEQDAVTIHREVMRENLAKFKDPAKALMAYNGGWDQSKWGNPETSAYVGKVQAALKGQQNPVVRGLNAATNAMIPSANAAQPAAAGGEDWWSSSPVVTADKPAAKAESGDLLQGAGNLVAGAVRGAGSIGATLLSPIDAAARAVNGGKPISVGGFDIAGQDRRAGMDGGLQALGAEPDSILYKGGKLAGEIAGTAGAGGAVANGLLRAAPAIASVAPAVASGITRLAPVIQSGGLVAGPGAPTNAIANLLLRSGGGAINGAVSAGLVNPEDAGTGAMIGGALPGAVQLAKGAGSLIKDASGGAVKHTLGMTTGTGGNSVSTAYNSGKEGATTFLDNMRGNVPMTDVLDSAKSALGQMRLDRSAQYKAGMAGVSADKTVIDFAPIDKAVSTLQAMGSYKGQVINKNASGVVDDISGLVNKWKSLDPAEYHTPEGLDALKQAISDIRDTTQFGTAGRKAADTAYNAVKGEITAQAPTYSKVMKDYSQASETLSEVERSLSLGNKAAADTSMRKLQSLMRNNVNTNFGNRLGLAQTLEQNGADILPAVAGQSMSSWTPRGLAGLAASGTGAAALLTNPAGVAALPFASPRLVGELAYGAGAAVRGIASAGSTANSKIMQVLGRANAPPITMNRLAGLLSTAPVVASIQR